MSSGTCAFDAGSPLLDRSGVQVGILSSGKGGCTFSGLPGIYSRVSYVSSWIEEAICAQSQFTPSSCTAADDTPVTSEEEQASRNNEPATPDVSSIFS